MVKKVIVVFLASFLLMACSGGPSESELSAAMERSIRSRVKERLVNASYMRRKEMKRQGILSPENMVVKKLTLEEQTEKENGDYVSKIMVSILAGNKEGKPFSLMVTTTVVDGELKILESETKGL